jgi:hypothetical protein
MTVPSIAAVRFLTACFYGVLLGVLYGFLRPVRRRMTNFADAIFVAAAMWAWLRLSFLICRGDIRLGCSMGLAVGAVAWEMTLGKCLRRPFRWFWDGVGAILRFLTAPVRKIFKKTLTFLKKRIASARKLVTINWRNRRRNAAEVGGKSHGRISGKLEKNQVHTPSGQSAGQSGAAERGGIFYGSDPGYEHGSGAGSSKSRRPAPKRHGAGAGTAGSAKPHR